MKILICGVGKNPFNNYPYEVSEKDEYVFLDRLLFRDFEGKGKYVKHDLNQVPLPFENKTFDIIFCSHVLEHVDNLIPLLEDFHRISKPRGKLVIIVPYWLQYGMLNDPTHRRFFNYFSFDFLAKNLQFSECHYLIKVEYRPLKRKYMFNRWLKLMEIFANKFPRFYESSPLRYIFSAGSVMFVFEVYA